LELCRLFWIVLNDIVNILKTKVVELDLPFEAIRVVRADDNFVNRLAPSRTRRRSLPGEREDLSPSRRSLSRQPSSEGNILEDIIMRNLEIPVKVKMIPCSTACPTLLMILGRII
jgi:hypothetical protein